jgi:hypothetical protein
MTHFRRWSLRSQASSPFSHPTLPAIRPASGSCDVHHVRGSERNYAQSRSCTAGDTDAFVRRVSGAHADCFGNDDQTRAAIGTAPSAHIQRSNNADRDRKQYRETPLRGNQRRGNGGLSLAASDNAYPTNRQQSGTDTAFRRVCSDIAVPYPGQYASVLGAVKNPRALLAAATRRS